MNKFDADDILDDYFNDLLKADNKNLKFKEVNFNNIDDSKNQVLVKQKLPLLKNNIIFKKLSKKIDEVKNKELCDKNFVNIGNDFDSDSVNLFREEKTINCFLINIINYKLVIPLQIIEGISLIDMSSITKIIFQKEWNIGVLQTKNGVINCIDTAKYLNLQSPTYIMKEKRYLLKINKVPFGLVVDDICQQVSICNTNIKWRIEKNKNPWFLGITLDYMCYILDPGSICKKIMESQA